MTIRDACYIDAPVDWVVGQSLAKARKAAGLSREAIAFLLGIEDSELADIEAGLIRPEPELLLELICILHVRLPVVFSTETVRDTIR